MKTSLQLFRFILLHRAQKPRATQTENGRQEEPCGTSLSHSRHLPRQVQMPRYVILAFACPTSRNPFPVLPDFGISPLMRIFGILGVLGYSSDFFPFLGCDWWIQDCSFTEGTESVSLKEREDKR